VSVEPEIAWPCAAPATRAHARRRIVSRFGHVRRMVIIALLLFAKRNLSA